MSENIRKNYDTLVYLIACALNSEAPVAEHLVGIDVDGISVLAARHSVGALATCALESVGLATSEMLEKKHMAIRKALLFNTERAEILDCLERKKIRYMPLKGTFLQELYPALGQREMSDNDILFDSEARECVKELMQARGYTVKYYGKNNHDVYVKPPVYNFEMHVSLLDERHELKEHCEYFADIFERSPKIDGTEYGYRMSDEDFYIFQRLHEYKHYNHGGTGLRSLADTYVFLRAKADTLDFESVERRLEPLGVAEYDRRSRELAYALFSMESSKGAHTEVFSRLSEEALEMYKYMCVSGAYGVTGHNIDNSIKKYESKAGGARGAKLAYLIHRIFPPMSYYKEHYPFFYKYKLLIPFHFLFRCARAIFTKPRKVWRDFVYIMKFDKRSK